MGHPRCTARDGYFSSTGIGTTGYREATIKLFVVDENFLEDAVPVSIFHIGLPLNHPSIPVDGRAELRERLDGLRQRMRDAGYHYDIVHASPEDGIEGFKDLLKTQPCDGVLIGGGVVGNPEMTYFLEQIVNTVREAAPNAKIMFFSHSVDVRETVERWFPPEST